VGIGIGKTGSKQERFEALLKDHAGIVFRIVRTYCRDTDDQLDLAQEVHLQLWRAFGRYDASRRFSTWMYRITLNTAISWTRRAGNRSRNVVSVEDAGELSAPAAIDPEAQTLYRLIDGLEPLDRALLMLYLEDLSGVEIGEVLGISAINVATKISRLKERLRNEVSESAHK